MDSFPFSDVATQAWIQHFAFFDFSASEQGRDVTLSDTFLSSLSPLKPAKKGTAGSRYYCFPAGAFRSRIGSFSADEKVLIEL